MIYLFDEILFSIKKDEATIFERMWVDLVEWSLMK